MKGLSLEESHLNIIGLIIWSEEVRREGAGEDVVDSELMGLSKQSKHSKLRQKLLLTEQALRKHWDLVAARQDQDQTMKR